MLKPQRLNRGDTVALVSLSSGLAGDSLFGHRAELGIRRLEDEFGLKVIVMPHALKGIEYVDEHPRERAEDLMDAFRNPQIKAIITMIGGDDTIRLLPYIDFDVIKSNPKIFMGYSDTTVNHFMMYHAGVSSFYGPCVLAEFAENKEMHQYTKIYVERVLFGAEDSIEVIQSPVWTSEILEWAEPSNNEILREMWPDKYGRILLQGSGKVRGRLLGGCIDVLQMMFGTKVWPKAEEWKDCILFLETSEDYPRPEEVMYLLRGLVAQGIVEQINGIIVGKPRDEKYFDEYQDVFKKVIGQEAGRGDLPILYNMNFGHTSPICVLPYGAMAEIDCGKKAFHLVEAAVD